MNPYISAPKNLLYFSLLSFSLLCIFIIQACNMEPAQACENTLLSAIPSVP